MRELWMLRYWRLTGTCPQLVSYKSVPGIDGWGDELLKCEPYDKPSKKQLVALARAMAEHGAESETVYGRADPRTQYLRVCVLMEPFSCVVRMSWTPCTPSETT